MSTTEAHDPSTAASDTSDQGNAGRRALFAKGAAAAAAATVAGLAIGRSASAANGGNMIIGASNTGTLTTQLSGGSTFYVSGGSSLSGSAAGKTTSIYGRQTVDNRVAVLGEFSGSVGGWGVYGYNNSSQGRGVCGINIGSGGVGVYGQHNDTSFAGTGVIGSSEFGNGVLGLGQSHDLVAGNSGRVLMSAAGTIGAPTHAAVLGTIARDTSGNLWYAFAANTWRKIAGSGTAGAFHPITPTRVYDSRWADGKILADQNRVVSVKDGRSLAGAVTTANLVPTGATAIVGNLTIAGTNAGAGALAVTPGDAAELTASTMNWNGAGVLLANGFTVKLDTNRQVKVFCVGTGTNFIIDIAGYYI